MPYKNLMLKYRQVTAEPALRVHTKTLINLNFVPAPMWCLMCKDSSTCVEMISSAFCRDSLSKSRESHAIWTKDWTPSARKADLRNIEPLRRLQ
uniref:Uncharacterized protein n=1 Tax=Romanomermis culicivorax TaxID=13658 RepID=A0A915J3E3_ROMCU